MAIKLSLTNLDGEVFDVITEMTDGSFTDSDGETVAENLKQLASYALPDLLDEAKRWAGRATGMKLDQRITVGDQPYNFDTLQDAADYLWLRGIMASTEYVELTGSEPPPYMGETVTKERLAEIRARFVPLCRTCEAALYYVAEYAAPGYGQSWRCENGHDWCKVGTAFYSEVPMLAPEDVI